MKHLITVLLLCSFAFSQSGIVAEAQKALDKKHHEALVEKAKKLLEEKVSLESRLEKVNSKLQDLDSGKNVKVDDDSACTNTTVVGWSSAVAPAYNVGQ